MPIGFNSASLVFWAALLAYLDMRYRRLPNVLTLGAWLVAILVLLVHQRSLLGFPASSALYAAGFGALVTLPAYALKWLAAGDVKMLVAIGLLTSLPFVVSCFALAAFVGGVCALLWLLLDRSRHLLELLPPSTPANLRTWLFTPLQARKMPYGALFALGMFVSIYRLGSS
jgi:prepilin peptidase CpaA